MSVLNQGHPPNELIVIDDGSTDCSLEIIRSYGSKIIYETGPNRGSQIARNRGLEIASGQYILFVDADDYIEGPHLDGLSRQAELTSADLRS